MNGPSRVDVEKDREAGDREEKVRVTGEAYRKVPFGIDDRISLVVVAVCNPELILVCDCPRSADVGTEAMNSGISSRSLSCGITSCLSLRFSLTTSFLGAATGSPPRCHGALNTASILGHNSDVADAICCILTGATAGSITAAIFPEDSCRRGRGIERKRTPLNQKKRCA